MAELELRRAADAHGKIHHVREQPLDRQSDYLSYVKALPAAILQNGLGQAMATELATAKGDEESAHRLLYAHIDHWLRQGAEEDAPYSGSEDLLEAIIGGDQPAYLRAHAETLAYLEWLKKFASAYLRKQERTVDGEVES